MTMFFHSLILGYGVATLGVLGLLDAGLSVWAVVPLVWIGGNVLALGFVTIGASLWPEKPARRWTITVTSDEFQLWDEDLTRELIDAHVRRDEPPAAAPATTVQAPLPTRAGGLSAAG